MSIPVVFSMSNSLYSLPVQPSHLEGCCRELALQPDHALLFPLLTGKAGLVPQSPAITVCLSLSLASGAISLWPPERALAWPLSPAASPWLACLCHCFVAVPHLGAQIQPSKPQPYRSRPHPGSHPKRWLSWPRCTPPQMFTIFGTC
uniref:Uncharacterized protein n=1 Tax=Accipiter nisus TaxID=211598 RepID=A0A8B9RY78_9AVES